MKIREDLVFDRSGDVIGFVDVGDITNKIRALEAQCNEESEVMVSSHYGQGDIHQDGVRAGSLSYKKVKCVYIDS